MEKNIRTYNTELRKVDGGNGRMVEGTAIVFGKPSQPIGEAKVIEYIDRSAVTQDVINNSDIFCYLNHDESRGVLARCRYGKGSLKLDLRDDGLHYSFEAPNTQLGDELLNYLERGEIYTSSFAFTTKKASDVYSRDDQDRLIRHVTCITRLFDVSPVFEPAYLDTSCSLRKLQDIQETDNKLDEIAKEIDFL